MKFTIALFALIPLIYALPAPERDLGALSARTQGNVFVCTDEGFTGGCTTLHGSSGQCVNVPLVFNDNISSVGPDSGQDCFFFMQGEQFKASLESGAMTNSRNELSHRTARNTKCHTSAIQKAQQAHTVQKKLWAQLAIAVAEAKTSSSGVFAYPHLSSTLLYPASLLLQNPSPAGDSKQKSKPWGIRYIDDQFYTSFEFLAGFPEEYREMYGDAHPA
ncbi:hypothetical protein B0H19DRAFT_1368973 [Mycena capillaripes]|nr:hypothetical protein B0H19DRAFT_1368973 [Mycena capillaripes]